MGSSQLAQLYVSVRANSSKLMPDLARIKGMLTGAFRGIARMAKSILRTLFSPMALLGGGLLGGAAGIGIIAATATFEAEMDKSMAIMKGAMGMEEELTAQARKTAKDLGMSHTEVAKSYFYLASAGLNAADSLRAMPIVAEFAAAGQFSMASATDMLTDALSALGMAGGSTAEKMKNLTMLGNVLVGANTLANASVEQFATALTTRAAGAMKTYGIQVEEGVAVLAAMADQGIKGRRAGTGFTTMLLDMAAAATTNAKAFEKFNVDVFDDQGKLQLTEIIEDLETSMTSLNDENRTLAMNEMGITATTQMLLNALIGTSGGIADYRKELMDVDGVMKTLAQANLDNLMGDFKKLKSNVVDTLITIGSALSPILRSMTDGVQAGVEMANSFLGKYAVEIESWVKGISDQINLLADAFRNITTAAEGDVSFDTWKVQMTAVVDILKVGIIESTELFRDLMMIAITEIGAKLSEQLAMDKLLGDATEQAFNDSVVGHLINVLAGARGDEEAAQAALDTHNRYKKMLGFDAPAGDTASAKAGEAFDEYKERVTEGIKNPQEALKKAQAQQAADATVLALARKKPITSKEVLAALFGGDIGVAGKNTLLSEITRKLTGGEGALKVQMGDKDVTLDSSTFGQMADFFGIEAGMQRVVDSIRTERAGAFGRALDEREHQEQGKRRREGLGKGIHGPLPAGPNVPGGLPEFGPMLAGFAEVAASTLGPSEPADMNTGFVGLLAHQQSIQESLLKPEDDKPLTELQGINKGVGLVKDAVDDVKGAIDDGGVFGGP